LAERGDDIGALAAHFSANLGVIITDEASSKLRERAWPGNVRELRSTIERAACLCNGKVITARDLGEAMRVGPPIILPTRLDVSQASHPARARHELLEACRAYGGDARRIAEALGIGRATLFRRLRAAGLSLRDLG
jgi:DNA-binding NtrC family response regulator